MLDDEEKKGFRWVRAILAGLFGAFLAAMAVKMGYWRLSWLIVPALVLAVGFQWDPRWWWLTGSPDDRDDRDDT